MLDGMTIGLEMGDYRSATEIGSDGHGRGEGYLVERCVRGCAAQIGCLFGLSDLPMAPFLFEITQLKFEYPPWT